MGTKLGTTMKDFGVLFNKASFRYVEDLGSFQKIKKNKNMMSVEKSTNSYA